MKKTTRQELDVSVINDLNRIKEINDKIGQVNGIATLNENGKVPSSQLDIDTSGLVTKEELTVTNTLKVIKSNKDEEGIYTVVTYKRKADDTIYCVSTLNGGTSPLYTTRTEQYYDVTGTSVIATHIYTLSYDEDENLISEV